MSPLNPRRRPRRRFRPGQKSGAVQANGGVNKGSRLSGAQEGDSPPRIVVKLPQTPSTSLSEAGRSPQVESQNKVLKSPPESIPPDDSFEPLPLLFFTQDPTLFDSDDDEDLSTPALPPMLRDNAFGGLKPAHIYRFRRQSTSHPTKACQDVRRETHPDTADSKYANNEPDALISLFDTGEERGWINAIKPQQPSLLDAMVPPIKWAIMNPEKFDEPQLSHAKVEYAASVQTDVEMQTSLTSSKDAETSSQGSVVTQSELSTSAFLKHLDSLKATAYRHDKSQVDSKVATLSDGVATAPKYANRSQKGHFLASGSRTKPKPSADPNGKHMCTFPEFLDRVRRGLSKIQLEGINAPLREDRKASFPPADEADHGIAVSGDSVYPA